MYSRCLVVKKLAASSTCAAADFRAKHNSSGQSTQQARAQGAQSETLAQPQPQPQAQAQGPAQQHTQGRQAARTTNMQPASGARKATQMPHL